MIPKTRVETARYRPRGRVTWCWRQRAAGRGRSPHVQGAHAAPKVRHAPDRRDHTPTCHTWITVGVVQQYTDRGPDQCYFRAGTESSSTRTATASINATPREPEPIATRLVRATMPWWGTGSGVFRLENRLLSSRSPGNISDALTTESPGASHTARALDCPEHQRR